MRTKLIVTVSNGNEVSGTVFCMPCSGVTDTILNFCNGSDITDTNFECLCNGNDVTYTTAIVT